MYVFQIFELFPFKSLFVTSLVVNEIFYFSQRRMDLFDLVSDLNKDAMKEKENNKARAKERVSENGNKKVSARRVKERVKDEGQKKVKDDEVF